MNYPKDREKQIIVLRLNHFQYDIQMPDGVQVTKNQGLLGVLVEDKIWVEFLYFVHLFLVGIHQAYQFLKSDSTAGLDLKDNEETQKEHKSTFDTLSRNINIDTLLINIDIIFGEASENN